MKKFFYICGICGAKYPVKGRNERIMYGCRKCGKGSWIKNNQELMKIEKFIKEKGK